MGQLGTDDPNAAPADAAKAEAGFAAMDLKPVTAPVTGAAAPAGTVNAKQAAPEPVKAEPAKTPGKVTLATVWPLGSVVLSPLEEGGKTVIITEEGTEVSEADADRARAEALKSGLRLREL
jgi:hypothetical protein